MHHKGRSRRQHGDGIKGQICERCGAMRGRANTSTYGRTLRYGPWTKDGKWWSEAQPLCLGAPEQRADQQ
jgi:hypothetical protein